MKQRGKKKKINERNKNNLRDLWDNVKFPNIQIIGVPEEEDKKKGHEKILEEIIVENFPKIGKEIITQVQERRNQKLYRQAKAERIQHHQTSSPTNAKGSSLDRKHRKGV